MHSYEWLEELLSKIKKKHETNVYRPNPYRASSAGECARKLAFTKLYPELASAEEKDARLLSLFQLGHEVHDTERALYEQLGYPVLDQEKKVSINLLMDDLNYLTVEGHIDGRLQLNEDEIIPIDIKTASDGKFNQARSMGVPYKYKCQGQFYLDALKSDRMWFIYYNKNTSERMVLEYVSDANISSQVRNRFASVYNTIDESNLPPREFLPYRKRVQGKFNGTAVLDASCAQCPFRSKCYPQFQLNEEGKHYVTTTEVYDGPYSK